ncbi:MAG: hypothetical protein V3U84_05265 [Thiotrichaceae bacterium]
MKLLHHLLYLSCFLLVTYSHLARAIQYETVVPPTSFETTGITNAGPSGDDSSLQVSIGFNFSFNGSTHSQLYINSNGSLSFNNGYTGYSVFSLPRSYPNSWILPFWHDLNPAASGSGSIKYGTVGSAPNRRFIVHWDQVYPYPWDFSYGQAICSFQVVLYEDGSIRYRYDENNLNCDGTNNGYNRATVGVQENFNPNVFTQHSYNTAIDLNKDIVYAPFKPALTVTKTSSVISDPNNGSTNPKRIPGSILRYTITVDNANSSHASNVNVADTLMTDVSWEGNMTITSPFINSGALKSLTDATDSDEGSFDGSALQVNCSFVTDSGPCIVTFDVSVD